jgi:hypothetical protein
MRILRVLPLKMWKDRARSSTAFDENSLRQRRRSATV